MGRTAGTVPGYTYSTANKNSGVVWGEQTLYDYLENPKKYAARYPVPSVAMDEPTFVPGIAGTKLVWRGPSWMNSNWYLWRGLKTHGRQDLADTIAAASVEMVKKSGFREYYNPLTAEGFGAEDFSWTGLVLDMVAPDA